MIDEERNRLIKKFNIVGPVGGMWGLGIFEGLQIAERFYEKPKEKIILGKRK